jgi:hypothetical protein
MMVDGIEALAVADNFVTKRSRVKNPKNIVATQHLFPKDLIFKIMMKRNGVMYGWKTAYVAASQVDGFQKVTLAEIRLWLYTKKIPRWAIDQVDQMTFQKIDRIAPQAWTVLEQHFLETIYREDPGRPDKLLSEMCTRKFRRTITTNAIKGALYRLREAYILPRDEKRIRHSGQFSDDTELELDRDRQHSQFSRRGGQSESLGLDADQRA